MRRRLLEGDRRELHLRGALAVVALAGIAVATYLVVVRLQGHSPTCVVGGGCATVQDSEYSTVVGVPVAVLGLMSYLGLLTSAILPGFLGRCLGLFVGIVAAGFSVWLTWLEVAVIEAICPWCVVSAALSLIAAGLVVARVALTSPPADGPQGAEASSTNVLR